MASQAKYFIKQFLSAYLSIWTFPIKLLFDACFLIFGALGSITIGIIAVLTGDTEEICLKEEERQTNSSKSNIGHRRKHYSGGDIQSSNKGNIKFGMLENLSNTLPRTSKTLDRHHRPAPLFKTSPPLLRRSETMRSPPNGRLFNLHGKDTCPIHSSPLSTQKSPTTNPFSFSSFLKSYIISSEVPSNDSSSSINDMKDKCTCSSSSSGASSPTLTSSWEDGLGRSMRVKINSKIKNRHEIHELERQMAILERRRHKSGELREMRRKQQEQEQQKSLDGNEHGLFVDAAEGNEGKEKITSLIKTANDDACVSICSKETNIPLPGGQVEDGGDSSLKRSSSSLSLPIEFPNVTEAKVSVTIDTETINLEDKNTEQNLEEKYYDNQPSKEVYPAARHTKYAKLDSPTTDETDKTNKNYDSITTPQITTNPSTSSISKSNEVRKLPMVKISYGDEADEIIDISKEPTVKPLHSNSNLLEIDTMKNIMKKNDIVGKGNATLTRGMSLSSPDFVVYGRPRARTISERAEENDMVMPLPVFPKSRKWKSCNAIPGPIPLNNKSGINKARTMMRNNNNAIVSAKQALKKEIAHWQELVVMAQKKQCDPMRLDTERKNGDMHYLNNTLQNGSDEAKINSEILNKRNHKTEQFIQNKSNTQVDMSRKPGARFDNGMTKNVTLNNNHNGIRSASIKGTIKRGNMPKFQGKSHSLRKKNKEELKPVHPGAQSPKTSLLARKIIPTMRNV